MINKNILLLFFDFETEGVNDVLMPWKTRVKGRQKRLRVSVKTTLLISRSVGAYEHSLDLKLTTDRCTHMDGQDYVHVHIVRPKTPLRSQATPWRPPATAARLW
jgi:hypothetical protein